MDGIDEQSQFSLSPLTGGILFLMIFGAVLCKCKRRRLNPFDIMVGYQQAKQIPKDKIIVALEIKDFFIKYIQRRADGFNRMRLDNEKGVISRIKIFLGFGHYYKLIYQSSQIKKFLKELKEIPNLQLYLYTTLCKNLTLAVLQRLDIKRFFPAENCRFCEEVSEDGMKHPSQVDKNTRRVLIITTTHKDHLKDDNKYFLVLNKKKLKETSFKDLLIMIQNLLSDNNVDNFSQKLEHLKNQIQIQQSDQSD